MSSQPAPEADIRWRVCCAPAETTPLTAAESARLRRFVEQRSQAWGRRICEFLGLSGPYEVSVVVRPGSDMSVTRDRHVEVGATAETVSAALAHELVHALAGPSASPVFREGLAVFVDSRLRLAGDVWPFYDLTPHRWTQMFVEDATFEPLATLLARRRIEPTPEEGISLATRLYLEAGSLVGFLVDDNGLDAFWPMYRSATLPAGFDAEPLQRVWLRQLGGAVTADEWRRREAAAARLVDDGRHGFSPAGAGRPRSEDR
jgi:hypothetical protein